MTQDIMPELKITPENVWAWAAEFDTPEAAIICVLGWWCFLCHRNQKPNDLAEQIQNDYLEGSKTKPISLMEKDELLKELLENSGAVGDASDMNELVQLPWFQGYLITARTQS